MASRPKYDRPLPGSVDPKLTVLDLLGEMKKIRENDGDHYAMAELRELVVFGEHIGDGYSEHATSVVPADGARGWPMEENRLFPTVQTLVARTDQGRIESKVWPRTPTPARLAAAEGANLVLDCLRGREPRDKTILDLIQWAVIHGKAGLYRTWDKQQGPYEGVEAVPGPDGNPTFDQATGLPMLQTVERWGGVRVEVVTCFDYWTSGEDKPENTRMQARVRYPDRYTADAMLAAAGIDKKTKETTHPVIGGRSYKGVEVVELWVKPQAMCPPGAFCVIVDGCYVTRAEAYPFEHKQLPICELKVADLRGTAHAFTPVKGAVSQQTLVNVAQRSLRRRLEIAGHVYCLASSSVAESINADAEAIARADGSRPASDQAAFIEPPEPPASMWQALQDARAALNDVMGVSGESVSGGDPSSTSSGEQLKTASALDSQKNVPLRRRTEVAVWQSDRQALELVKQFTPDPVLWNMAGDAVRAMYLRGADLDGVDLMLEPASGLAESHLGRARSAEEGAAAGLVPPADATELRQTGVSETALNNEQRARLEKQGFGALRGEQQQPDPSVPGAGAAKFLRTMLATAPGQSALLLRLIAGYEQMAAQQGQQQAAAAGAAQGGPGAPSNGARPKLPASTKNALNEQVPEGVQ